MTLRDFSIRLSLKDGAAVERGLVALGEKGEYALSRIQAASLPASRGMLAMNAVVTDAQSTMMAYGGRAGVVGAGMMAMGPAGLAAAAAVGGLTAAMLSARKAVEDLSIIGDVAAKIGISSSALQELRFAAGQANIETAGLDKAMTTFSRGIGEAAQGGGELSDIFKKYGIAVRDAHGNTRGVVEVLGDLANAVKRTGDDSENLRIAYAAFGREGGAMVNILSDGREGLEAFSQKARDAGLVIDDALIKTAGEAGNKLKEMEQVIDVKLNVALMNLQGPLLAVRGWMADAAVTAGWAVAGVGAFFDELGSFFNRFDPNSLEALQIRLDGLNKSIADNVRQMASADIDPRRISLLTAEIKLWERLAQTTEAAINVKKAKPLVIDIPGPRPRDPTGFSDKEMEAFNKAFESYDREQEKLRERSLSFLDSVNRAYLQSTKDIIGLINMRRDAQLAALDKMKLSEQEYAAARTQILASANNELADHMNSLTLTGSKVFATWQEDLGGFNRGFSQSMAGIAVSADKGFGDVLISFRRMAVELAADRFIARPAEKFMDRMVDGLMGWTAGVGGGSRTDALDMQYQTVSTAHGGGVVGSSSLATRSVHPAAFEGAPRFHRGGLLAGEMGIIALRNERVLTEAQQSNTAQTLSALASLAARPSAGGGDMRFDIQVVNQTSTPVQATATQGLDGMGMGGGRQLKIMLTPLVAEIMGGPEGGSALRRGYGVRPLTTRQG